MKKVLMIAYSFPPRGGGGVLRQFKFAKYLPQFNWQPFILTGNRSFFFQDEQLLEELGLKEKLEWGNATTAFFYGKDFHKLSGTLDIISLARRSGVRFPIVSAYDSSSSGCDSREV